MCLLWASMQSRESALAALRQWVLDNPGVRQRLVAAAYRAGNTVTAVANAADIDRRTVMDDIAAQAWDNSARVKVKARDRARRKVETLDALREWAATGKVPRHVVVAAAWNAGNRNIGELADIVGVKSTVTIYTDLKAAGVTIPGPMDEAVATVRASSYPLTTREIAKRLDCSPMRAHRIKHRARETP